MSPRPLKDRLLLVAFLVVLVVFGSLVARKYWLSRPGETVPEPVSVVEAPRELREIMLYFGAPDGAGLMVEAREIEDCLTEEECLLATVQALVNGPIGDLLPIFPSHTVVRQVAVEGTVATVDFSRDLIRGHPGGSQSELLTAYGLANTLAVNFPHIRQALILVEGETVVTLKGHVDLREPVAADFSFGRQYEQEGKSLEPPLEVPAQEYEQLPRED